MDDDRDYRRFTRTFLTEDLMTDEPPARIRTHSRLRQFRDHDKPIENRRYLGNGQQGVVFDVHIGGARYALKLVCRFPRK